MGLKQNIDGIAGIDISNGKATIVVLHDIPDDLKQFHRRHAALEITADAAGIATLLALPFQTAVLEPTGVHYSRLFADALTCGGKTVQWVDHVVIANYRKAHQLPNKNDAADALALAAYGLAHHGKPRFFLSLTASRVRELYLQLESLNTIKNPIINRLRQQLAHEFPEVSKRAVHRDWCRPNPPGLWRFLAGEDSRAQWHAEYARSIGSGLSAFSRGLAALLCQLERQECAIETELAAALNDAAFTPYLRVFATYGITNRTAAALLSRIYPLEKFLGPDGRQIIDHDGNTKRNRSIGAFKLSLGMGMVQHQSGNTLTWKPGGASYCRTALWRWCRTTLLMRSQTDTPELLALWDYYQACPAKGNSRVMKTVSKMLRMLYRDLLAAL